MPEIKKQPPLTAVLSQGGTIHGAGVYDTLTARIVETSGLDFAYLSGFAFEAAQLAAPDIGLINAAELADQIARMTEAVDFPVICDIDTGFGGLNNVWRTARGIKRAGAAGLQIEDQANPKRCPVLPGRVVVSRSEAVDRVATVLDAVGDDDDFLVIARTDAEEIGIDEAVARCNAFLDAGAHVAFPVFTRYEGADRRSLDADRQMELMAEMVAAISGPVMSMGPPKGLTAADLFSIGYQVVLHPTELLEAAMTALHQLAAAMSTTGSVDAYFASHPKEHPQLRSVFDYLGVEKYVEREGPRSQ